MNLQPNFSQNSQLGPLRRVPDDSSEPLHPSQAQPHSAFSNQAPPHMNIEGPTVSIQFSKVKKPAIFPKTSTASLTMDTKFTINNKPITINAASKALNERNKRDSSSGPKIRTLSAENKAKEGGPLMLAESYLEQGYQDSQDEDYIKALFNTLLAKKVIDDFLKKDWKFSFDIMLVTFYNLSAIHYKLKNFEECSLYVKNALSNYEAYKVCNSRKYHAKSTWYNFSLLQDQASYLNVLMGKNMYRKYKCKIHLQGCIVNSQLGNSVEAFSHASQAAKIACRLLFDSLLIAYHLYLVLKNSLSEKISLQNQENVIRVEDSLTPYSHRRNGSSKMEGIEKKGESESTQRGLASDREKGKDREWVDYLEKIIPILEEILEKVKGKKSTIPTANRPRLLYMLRKVVGDTSHFKETNMKSLYEGLPQDHFLYTSNVMAIAQLNPIWTTNLKKGSTLKEAISVDALIEQIILVTVSVYCISTELRFWSNSRQSNNTTTQTQNGAMALRREMQVPDKRLKEASELWVGRSVALAFVYLPHDSLLAEQIFNIYSKIYDPTKTAIPEDEEVAYHLKYLVPAKGISKFSSSFIPVIKKNPEDEIDGIEGLLFLHKDLSESTTNIVNEIKLFDTKSPLHELLIQNYTEVQVPQNIDFSESFKKFMEKNVTTKAPGKKQINRSLTRIANRSPNRTDSSFSHLRRIYLPNPNQKPEDVVHNTFTLPGGRDRLKESDIFDKKNSKRREEEEKGNEPGLRVMTDPAPHEGGSINLRDSFSRVDKRPSVNKLRPFARLGFEEAKRKFQQKIKGAEHAEVQKSSGDAGSVRKIMERESPMHIIQTNNEVSISGDKTVDNSENLRNMKLIPPVVGRGHPLSQLIEEADQRIHVKSHLKASQDSMKRPFFRLVKEDRSNSPSIRKGPGDLQTAVVGEMKMLKLRPRTTEKGRPQAGKSEEKSPIRDARERENTEESGRQEDVVNVSKGMVRNVIEMEEVQKKVEARERDVKSRSGSVGRGINVVKKSEVMIKKSKRAY